MTSSGSEDEQAIQEDLWRHLSAYLEEQLDDTVEKRRKKSRKARYDNSKQGQLMEPKRSAMEHVMKTVGKVKELTSAMNKQKALSAVPDLANMKGDDIKEKVKKALNKSSLSNTSETSLLSGNSQSSSSDDDDDGDGIFDDWEADEHDESDEDHIIKDVMSPTVNDAQLEKFKSSLGITDTDLCHERDNSAKDTNTMSDERVKTVASSKSNKPRPPPDIVVFQGHRSRRKPHKQVNRAESIELKERGQDQSEPDFDLHKARFEVRKFGISGLQGSQKETGMIDLLVKLGAKPPKREYINYKELQQRKKEELAKVAAQRELDRQFGFKVVKTNNNKRRRPDDIGFVDGQVGSYRHGVQVIHKKDIKEVTRNKRRK